jgi:hypothetical protein
MKWIWQQPDWPDFRYDELVLEHRELEFRLNSERLAGSFSHSAGAKKASNGAW